MTQATKPLTFAEFLELHPTEVKAFFGYRVPANSHGAVIRAHRRLVDFGRG